MPSKVLSMRIPETQDRRLQRMARRLGHTTAETGALLIEEGLRRSEFAFIDFRDTPSGRQPFLQSSRIPVWMAVKIVRAHRGDIEKAAGHLRRSPMQIQAALNYAKAFPDEIESAIQDNDSLNFEKLSQMLPQTALFEVRSERK